MQDRVSLYPGRVRLTPVSGQENTYDMVRADEPTQEGDTLSKATFLKDDTAALFGLDATAVPDDALALLSRFHKGLGNEYVWEKYKTEDASSWTEATQTNFAIGTYQGSYSGITLYYSNEIRVTSDSKFEIVNPQTVISNNVYETSNTLAVLRGKYFALNIISNDMFKAFDDTSITFNTSTRYHTISRCDYLSHPKYQVKKVDYSYLNSPDPNAYPPAVSDGYTYMALGQLGDKVKIELISYVGTNTYGENNPNILTFDFKPKFLWFVGQQSVSGGNPFSPATPSGNFYSWIATENTPTTPTSRVGFGNPNNIRGWMSEDGKTLTWFNYSTSNASDQLNSSNDRYYYLAIG